MDPQKFYECERENLYNVHFPNKMGYSVEDIKKIFSEFGEVAFVRKAGDDFGFRFVKYRTKEEILRCIEGMKNHKTIKLLPKRVKHTNDQRNSNETNKRESRESKTTRAPWDQMKSGASENVRWNNTQRTEEHREVTSSRSDSAAKTEEAGQNNDDNPEQTSSNVASQNETDINKETDPGEPLQQEVDNRQDVQAVDAEDIKPVDSPIQPAASAEANEVCDPAVDSIPSPLPAAITLSNPDLHTVMEEAASRAAALLPEDEPESPIAEPTVTIPLSPSMITRGDLPRLVQKSRKSEIASHTESPVTGAEMNQATIEAQPIVVANIHTDYGVHYILHLFQKHDPICVSPMKIILKQGLRYCVVYVQSPLQARDIEKKFDNYSLCGKELIVLRAQKLSRYANEL